MKLKRIGLIIFCLFFLESSAIALANQPATETAPSPLHFDYNYHAGPYIRIVQGTIKDPAGLRQALLPLKPPPGASGDYGLLGDDNLLGQPTGYGLRQLGIIARHYITFDFIYVEQPPGFEEIGIQSGVFTQVERINNYTLGWVFFDLRPDFETDLKKHLGLPPE